MSSFLSLIFDCVPIVVLISSLFFLITGQGKSAQFLFLTETAVAPSLNEKKNNQPDKRSIHSRRNEKV